MEYPDFLKSSIFRLIFLIMPALGLQPAHTSVRIPIGLKARVNGMGKTTTIRSMIDFNRPTSGEIIFKGSSITSLQAYQIARMGAALVPQERRIFYSLPFGNVLFKKFAL